MPFSRQEPAGRQGFRRHQALLPRFQRVNGTFFLSTSTMPKNAKEAQMLGWALTFLVVALIAAVLGFSGVAAISVEIAQLLVIVFLVLFVGTLILRAIRK